MVNFLRIRCQNKRQETGNYGTYKIEVVYSIYNKTIIKWRHREPDKNKITMIRMCNDLKKKKQGVKYKSSACKK